MSNCNADHYTCIPAHRARPLWEPCDWTVARAWGRAGQG